MYLVIVIGFILFLIVLSGNWSALKPVVFILAIPLFLWIFLRLFVIVGVAFRSGLIGGIFLALAILYLIKSLKR